MLKQEALDVMKSTARKLGFRVKPNARQDWSVFQKKHWRGIIVVAESDFDAGSPVAVCCRHNNWPELDELRHEMNQALMRAGFLQPARGE